MTMAHPIRAVLLLLAILAIESGMAYAQPQAVTRVEGVIQDEESGGPVGCKIYIYDPNGKRIRSISSNSKDGTYLMVLNDAGKHKLVLGGHNVYRKEYDLEVPKSTEFQEIKQNYTVRVFREGTELFAAKAFEPNSSVLTAEGRHGLASILEALNDNQQLQVVMDIYPDQDQMASAQADSIKAFIMDSLAWDKEMKAYEKKYRRKKEKPEPPAMPARRGMPTDPNNDLVNARKQALKDYFKDVRNADLRIAIDAKPLPASAVQAAPSEEEIIKELTAKKSKKSSKGKKGSASADEAAPMPMHNTLVVKIGEVKRLFGD